MKRYKQLIKHDPDNGLWGDCFRTGIACLLSVEPDEVPHFCDQGGSWKHIHSRSKIQEWLKERGAHLLHVNISADGDSLDSPLEYWYQMNRNTPVLISVKSVSCNHIIVCRNREVFCDPATGKPAKTEGYLPIECEETGVKFWEIWFLGWNHFRCNKGEMR